MSTPSGRDKLAALKARQARSARQRKLLALASGAVVVVLAVVAVFYFVGARDSGIADRKAVAASKNSAYIDTIVNIPAETYDAVGAGAAQTAPKPISDKPLIKAGKPEVLYIGAEFCPYCGMERWALTAALSRFGTFSGLKTGVSSPKDRPTNIPTLSYRHAKYTSKYLTFTTFETADRHRKALQTPDTKSMALLRTYDTDGSIPFIDYGNRFVSLGATYQGSSYMQNASGAEIAAQLKDPSSEQAQGIIGAANVLTSRLCGLTDGKPASVCASDGVVRAAAGA